MSGYVNEMGAVGDHLDALGHEPIDHPIDCLLVAGDRAGREDHAVALAERDLGMLVLGDARQCGARLALAPGAQCQHLVRRQVAVGLGAAKLLHAVEVASLARNLDHAIHGAADQHDLAVGSERRTGHRAQASDMGSECRDGDAGRRGAG